MKKRWFIGLSAFVALSLLLSLFLGGCQNRPTAEEIVAKMREVEASTEDAHAVLELSIQGQGMDEDLVVEVWEKKPDKLRAEVLEASDTELVGAISVTFPAYAKGERDMPKDIQAIKRCAEAGSLIQGI